MNFDYIGLISILFVTLLVRKITLKEPSIGLILYVALAIRIIVIFINHNIFILPDAIGDAARFELKALEMSEGGFVSTLMNYTGFNSFSISWVIAILYSIFGQSELMAQSLSLFLGVGVVYLGWIASKKIWDDRSANKAGWALALFPTLILYSVLILREVYVCFFLMLALNGIIDWYQKKNLKSLILLLSGFFGAAFFHSAMIIGLIAFLTIVFLKNMNFFVSNIIKLKISIKSLIVFLLIFLSISFIKSINFSKIEALFAPNENIKKVLVKIKDYDRGTAKYPNWMVPENEIEIIYKSPFRILYFVFAPFPWDVDKPSHLVGMIDGFLYIFLSYIIFRNRKKIWSDPILRIIFLILLSYLIVFGIGVGNFGTGIRHRSKFIAMFILLAAPLLPKLIFSIKNNIKKNKTGRLTNKFNISNKSK